MLEAVKSLKFYVAQVLSPAIAALSALFSVWFCLGFVAMLSDVAMKQIYKVQSVIVIRQW